jgi:hypothetical protein
MDGETVAHPVVVVLKTKNLPVVVAPKIVENSRRAPSQQRNGAIESKKASSKVKAQGFRAWMS